MQIVLWNFGIGTADLTHERMARVQNPNRGPSSRSGFWANNRSSNNHRRHGASRADQFSNMTVPELKGELKKRSLPVGGRKEELISRLREHANETVDTGATPASIMYDKKQMAMANESPCMDERYFKVYSSE